MKRRQWIAFVMMLAMLATIVVGKLPAPQASAAAGTRARKQSAPRDRPVWGVQRGWG